MGPDGLAPDPRVARRASDAPEASSPWPAERVIHRGERRPLSGSLGGLVRLLDRVAAPFWTNPLLFLVLVGLVVWAGVWGFTAFYGAQFARTPPYVWLFVPDSPLSTTVWLVAALVLKMGLDRRPSAVGKGWSFFANWAAMMNIKVGLWTVFVLLYHHEHYFRGGTQSAFQWMLVLTHTGMVGLAILLMRKAPALPPAGYALILGLGFLWDFMDYFFVHFFLPGSGITIFPNGVPTAPETIRVVAYVSVLLTLLATAVLTLTMHRRGPPVSDQARP